MFVLLIEAADSADVAEVLRHVASLIDDGYNHGTGWEVDPVAYTLPELRNGTGFRAGARFVEVSPR